MDQLDSESPALEVHQRKATLAEVGLGHDPIHLVQQDPLKVSATVLALHPDQVVETQTAQQKELVKAQAQALLQEPLQLQALLQESVQLEALLQESVQLQADEVFFLVVEQLQVALQLAYCRYQYPIVRATA